MQHHLSEIEYLVPKALAVRQPPDALFGNENGFSALCRYDVAKFHLALQPNAYAFGYRYIASTKLEEGI
jgi:hypothetical protein